MLRTKEGEKISQDDVLGEYPRPQFRRDSYLNLNGLWDFKVDLEDEAPDEYGGKILVPFAVESELSGVNRRIGNDEYMHYRREFEIPEGFNKGRILLHIDAVDQVSDVIINGMPIAHNEGGYNPIVVELSKLKPGKNVLQVEVRDDTDSEVYPRGKQVSQPGGVWYTPTSGIWQSVWLESVPKNYIESIKLTPSFKQKKLFVHASYTGSPSAIAMTCLSGGKPIKKIFLDTEGNGSLDLSDCFHPWSPEDPFLYDLKFEAGEDVVYSYFAMREFSFIEHKGHRVFALNGKPLFLTGVLDQGYYPDGGLTNPTDQALIDDIKMCKDMGFNMIRKHIKVEPLRWYYHCDRMGMIVIQDIMNGGRKYLKRYVNLRPFIPFNKDDELEVNINKLGRGNPRSRAQFIKDMGRQVELLYNCPCIAIWTLFNEGWGQFKTVTNWKLLKTMDPTRPIDANSGWFDRGVGDFDSHHIYFHNIAKMKGDGKRTLSLTEFGGFTYKVAGHEWPKASFGYRFYKNEKAFTKAMVKLYEKKVKAAMDKSGLSIAVYTQLSDVEGEANGLITYDRRVLKIDPKIMKGLNDQLKFGEDDAA
ncbi:MAG: glycoside hydrolase family 2 TIM barrel-domain containing protein [Bacillota bacterium]|nr:glycoside hydrolase family 2 TIM barrel-domain containing protein [Bacillota bacterium]